MNADSDAVIEISGAGVWNPVAWIRMPIVDGTLTLKLYSSSQDVVKTLTNIPSEATVELIIPEWNSWIWVGGWRDADDALVLSI